MILLLCAMIALILVCCLVYIAQDIDDPKRTDKSIQAIIFGLFVSLVGFVFFAFVG